jgi:hypothetical protein
MFEKTFKTTHGKLNVRIPTILNEITLGQIMEMQEIHYVGELEAIRILSGIPQKELDTVIDADDFRVFDDLVHALANQIKYLNSSDIIPHKVTFMLGKRKVNVNVIRDLSIEPAGAFLATRNIIADEINEHINLYGEEGWKEHFQPSLKSCCHVLSQYFYCRATGKKYDEQEAEDFEDEVKKLRVTEALPIAKHFFSCYPDLIQQKIGFLQRLQHYFRRKIVLKRLKNNHSSN